MIKVTYTEHGTRHLDGFSMFTQFLMWRMLREREGLRVLLGRYKYMRMKENMCAC